MPILDLTPDVPRFPNIGKLRKGGEKVKGGYGPDLDHFRFTSLYPEVAAAFREAYGNQPKTIRVFLPYASYQESFSTWCELWGASGLIHRCDGKTMYLWQENGKYIRGQKPCPGGHTNNDPKEDAVGRLTMLIPELIQAGFVGYVTLETHSKHDILAILGVLMRIADSSNNVSGIEFSLSRYFAEVSAPGWGDRKGQRSKVTKSLVRLLPAPTWVKLQLEMANRAVMNAIGSGSSPVAALPASSVVDAKATDPDNLPVDKEENHPQGNVQKTTKAPEKSEEKPKTRATKDPYKDLPADVQKLARVRSVQGIELGTKTPAELKELVAWFDAQDEAKHKRNPTWKDIRAAAAGLIEYFAGLPQTPAEKAPEPVFAAAVSEATEGSDQEPIEAEYQDVPEDFDQNPPVE